jgi:alpha-glucoside transport system permease protein
MSQIIQAITAIILGVGGMMAYFYGANYIAQNNLGDLGRKRVLPWVFVGPALFVLFVYLIYPTIYTFYLSLLNSNSTAFAGLANYQWAFSSEAMLQSFVNNVLWIMIVPTFCTIFGLLVAILADRVPWENIGKAIIFLPMAISFVGASVIWRFIYYFRPEGQTQIGLLNAIYTAFGASPQAWLTNAPWNNLFLMVIMIWIQTGFAMVLLSAALKAVPDETIEAARIDGANEITVFFRIIIPQMANTIGVVMTTIIILVLKIFDVVFVMTSGQFGTEVIANQMYSQLFSAGQVGRGSAAAMILMIAVLPIMVVNIRRFQAEEAMR